MVGGSSWLCHAGLLPRIPSCTFIGSTVLEGTLSPQRTSLWAISGTTSPAPARSWKVELLGICPKIGIWGRGIGKATETLSCGTVIKPGIYVSTSPPFFLSLYLFQLPMANSADVYMEQINEGITIWAPSHARLCGENWTVEVNLQSRGEITSTCMCYRMLWGGEWDSSFSQS